MLRGVPHGIAALAMLALSSGGGAIAQTDTGRQASSDVATIERCVASAKDDGARLSCIGRVSQPCIDAPDGSGSSTMGMNGCYAREIAAWDTRLNRTYKDVGASMSESADLSLRDTQRAWIAFRDKACDWPSLVYPGGSIIGPLSGECLQTQTGRRALDLDRIKAALTER
ncbi:lysozyme inhibitor LprI family protein [Methylobacterium bullatum]